MFIMLIILSVLTTTATVHARRVYFKAGNCTPGTDYFSYFEMYIKKSAIYMDMMVIKAIQAGMLGHIDFEMSTGRSTRYQRLFQHDLNYCNMLVSAKKTIFKRWFDTVFKHGNITNGCPVPPGIYYLYNWIITGDLVPSYLSVPGEYRVKGRAFYRKSKPKREQLVLECVVEATFK